MQTMGESLLLALYENEDNVMPIAETMKQLIERMNRFILLLLFFFGVNLLEASATTDNNSIPQVLFKSSVYTSVGHSSHYLYQYLDFSSWFLNRLVHELNNNNGQGYAL